MRVRSASAVLPSLVVILVLTLSLVGCKKSSSVSEKRYPIEGTVISVDKPQRSVTLKHKDIPGFMKAMTMPFKVKDQWALDKLDPGDYVSATLVVSGDEGHLEDISINKDQRQADQSSTSPAHVPSVGERVPDFTFVDQNGRKISLSKFRGRPLLLTFIYTRCPLPDYCIRMSNNFAQVARTMQQQNPEAFKKLQMLSISIDPEYDKPAVLKQYAKAYAGTIDPELQHWTFATGSPEEIQTAAQFFGLTYLKQDRQIVHDLRTAVIDSNGMLAELYRGNGWTPAQAVETITSQKM